ncbi:MAG: alpha-N-arabinofuranosidase [Bacteroidota bacterium]|nr:alpha-N-arabinofuranosidase [Bacteroidota bacterium]
MQFKTLTHLLFAAAIFISSNAAAQVQLALNTKNTNTTISRHIYGHFAEHLGRSIYDGFWVSDTLNVPKKDRIRLDIVDALKRIRIPNLRWPGGCFADEYHWRDGVGPRTQRPRMVNTNWGGVVEDNSFGTHEFLELCSLLNTEPYIAGNVGSGTVEEMSKWIEYLNFDGESPMANLRKQNGHPQPYNVRYWGVGNENWGCGGNMTAEYYANEYKRYASYAKNYPNAGLRKIAGGPSSSDYHWTETLMKNIPGHMMWGVSLHHYTIPTGSWEKKGSATQFDEAQYFNTMKNCLQMDELLTRHSAIMDKYDSARRVALVVDEWGIWTDVEPGTNPGFLYQQNSLRDALIAGTHLNIFNNHAGRVRMANLAQTVNVLQALILTQGRQMLLTPTYHVFDLFKVHHDAKLVPVQFSSPDYVLGNQKLPALNVSASLDSAGTLHISLVNIDPAKPLTVQTTLDGGFKTVSGRMITSANLTDVNSFSQPEKVVATNFNGARLNGKNLSVTLPAKSVVTLALK